MPRTFHPYVHMHPPQSKDRQQRFVCRDGLALFNLSAALRAQGFEDGEPIVAFALHNGASKRERVPIKSRYGRNDSILLCTRPALDDDEEDGPRKTLLRGDSPLEDFVVAAARARFSYLDRAEMHLDLKHRALLPPGLESRSHVAFSQRMWAPIKRLHGQRGKRGLERRPDGKRTLAFVLNAEELWQRGPSLHCVFAMDSATAVGWSAILRHRHPDWVTAPGFRMVELALTRLTDSVEDTRFGLEWKEETLLYVPE